MVVPATNAYLETVPNNNAREAVVMGTVVAKGVFISLVLVPESTNAHVWKARNPGYNFLKFVDDVEADLGKGSLFGSKEAIVEGKVLTLFILQAFQHMC